MHRQRQNNGAAVMSITGINGYANYWPWQNQGTQSSTGSSAATTSGNNISNTGSVSASSNMAAFVQAFSADLESLLTQMGNEANTSASATSTTANATSSSSTTASATSATDPSQNPNAVHHHHHHHDQGGGSMEGDANQLVGEIGQSLQGGTLSTSQINQSASLLATDMMQALQSYGTSATNALALPGISTVA
jgi:hypothetical protein